MLLPAHELPCSDATVFVRHNEAVGVACAQPMHALRGLLSETRWGDCMQVRLQSMLLLGLASSALVVARAPLRACLVSSDGSTPQVLSKHVVIFYTHFLDSHFLDSQITDATGICAALLPAHLRLCSLVLQTGSPNHLSGQC